MAGVNRETARPAQRVKTEQYEWHQDTVQVEDREYAPNQRRVAASAVVNTAIELAIQMIEALFALPLSLIQNSAPYATRSALRGKS